MLYFAESPHQSSQAATVHAVCHVEDAALTSCIIVKSIQSVLVAFIPMIIANVCL